LKLIQRIKIWKDLRRLEQRAKSEPSPSTFVDLGQVYINLGMHDRAERMAADGLALFPRSIELRQLLDCARRGLRSRRADELRAKLIRQPSGESFEELARIYSDLGDSAALHQLCTQWSLRFPDDARCWLASGEAHLSSFYRDLKAQEGAAAVKSLERALELEEGQLQARRMLSELLYRVGAVHDARRHLELLQEASPDDEDLRRLLTYLGGLQDMGTDVDALLGEVELHGSLLHPVLKVDPRVTGGARSAASVRAGLARVADIEGVVKATFIRGSKAMVKGEIADGRDPFLRVVRVTAKAAHRFARRVDLGNAAKTVLEGDFGRICVCVYGEALAAAQVTAQAESALVLEELQELVAGALHPVAT
jgi:hypothetical protein